MKKILVTGVQDLSGLPWFETLLIAATTMLRALMD